TACDAQDERGVRGVEVGGDVDERGLRGREGVDREGDRAGGGLRTGGDRDGRRARGRGDGVPRRGVGELLRGLGERREARVESLERGDCRGGRRLLDAEELLLVRLDLHELVD